MKHLVLFTEAFAELKKHCRHLFPVLVLPLLVVGFSEHSLRWLTVDAGLSYMAVSGIGFLVSLVEMFFYIVIALIIHRSILIGKGAIAPSEVLIPRMRTFNYFIYSLAMGIMLIPFFLLNFIPGIGDILMLLSVAYICSRLCLVLPAVAIDQSPSYGDAWRSTKGHQWLMFFSIGLFPFLISSVEVYVYQIPYVGLWIGPIVTAVVVVYTTAMISVAYERFGD